MLHLVYFHHAWPNCRRRRELRRRALQGSNPQADRFARAVHDRLRRAVRTDVDSPGAKPSMSTWKILSLTDLPSQSALYYGILMLPGSAGVAHIVECFFSRWPGSGLPSIDVAQLGAVGVLGRQASPKQHRRWQWHAVIFPIRRYGTAFFVSVATQGSDDTVDAVFVWWLPPPVLYRV